MPLEEFVKQFHLLMDRGRSRTQHAYLRSVINSEEEASRFIDLFAEKTNTIWIPQTGKHISPRYSFYLTWFCTRSWRKKTTSQEDDCPAKIDIYVRKPEPSSAKYDEYMHYDPPLPCIIEIVGQHSHPLECLDYQVTQSVKDKVKSEFFNYFQMGLSVSDAKNKYALRHKKKKTLKAKHTPTLRQAQRLYNQWKGENSCSTLKGDNQTESQAKPVTFKEFLNAVPKREILYSVKHLQSETDTPRKPNTQEAKAEDIQFPLVFISVGCVAAMPNSSAPLLYKLKHGKQGELVSDLVNPRIYSVYIDSAASVVVKGQLTETSKESQNSSHPTSILPSTSVPTSILPSPSVSTSILPNASDEILGVPMPVDEIHLPVEAILTETLDISIKLEPLNDGYEDVPSQDTTEKAQNTPIMPVITQAFSCGDATTTEEIDIKPNICSADSAEAEEIDIKPNVCCDKAGNSFFPLVFTLKGSIYKPSCGRLLIYDLKQGSSCVQATEIVIPQISSVQIKSLNKAAFQFKDASMLNAEGPLSISVQTEFLRENLSTTFANGVLNEKVYEKDIIPVILNASSCSDIYPVIADSVITLSKRRREDSPVTPVVAPANVAAKKKVILRKNFSRIAEVAQVPGTTVYNNDQDYLFLMSLLPELKRIPQDEKYNVKSRIRDIFATSRPTTNRIQFENKSTNIYRDCGVLPISGGWKF